MKEKIKDPISDLENLAEKLGNCTDFEAKNELLDEAPYVIKFFEDYPDFSTLLSRFNPEEQYLFKAILALGEGPIVFYGWESDKDDFSKVRELAQTLKNVEKYYSTLGGIIGYHTSVLKLINDKTEESNENRHVRYLHPPGLDISNEHDYKLFMAIKWGIDSLSLLGEIYPVGGAGDRLGLVDQPSGTPLPAAMLPFAGYTLLELLFRDVWGREYLRYKLTGEQVAIPVALMTSAEKNNDAYIKQCLAENQWFGREETNFMLFEQPLVPVITIEGHWSMKSLLDPSLKPGGHGVMWKLAFDKGVLRWLKERGVKKLLVRQVNNPLAGIDHGLLAFTGLGTTLDKYFGFCSCRRKVGTAEGVNVLIEEELETGYSYSISCIEYTDFKKNGIEDVKESEESPFSQYPSNTNILFADLKKIEEEAPHIPVPGMLINMKTEFPFTDSDGNQRMVKGGRLESMMQNIAEKFDSYLPFQIDDTLQQIFDTFVTYNTRRKTISVTKNKYVDGKEIIETPLGAFYDLQLNNYNLLTKYCNYQIHSFSDHEHYLKEGPSILLLYHPAIGPNWSIIAQKIDGGKMAEKSEMQLEITEIELKNLDLDGSLCIKAERVYGIPNVAGKVHFSNDIGNAVLVNVTIRNRGIDRIATVDYWKNEIHRHEALTINIAGNGEFFAENVTFEGNVTINVPDGVRMVVKMIDDSLVFHEEELQGRHWKYAFDQLNRIVLTKGLTAEI